MATMVEIVQAAHDALLVVIQANPSDYVDYRIGDKSVSKSQYVQHLKDIIKLGSDMPEADFDFATFQMGTGPTGQELTEFDT